jgi:hypothetical protein
MTSCSHQGRPLRNNNSVEAQWRHHHPRFLGREFVLADGAYSSCAHTLSPYRADRVGGMGVAEELANSIIQYYRARVEHIIGVVTAHAFFRTPRA